MRRQGQRRTLSRYVGLALCMAGLVLAWLAVARPALAHEIRPAVLALQEQAPGHFLVTWTSPVSALGTRQQVTPRFSAPCVRRMNELECGRAGLSWVEFDLADTKLRVVVQVRHANGRATTAVLSSAKPRLFLGEQGSARGPSLQLFRAYLELGVQHILSGLDHVLFVIALLLLVSAPRRIFWTITAFTLAHSLTLAVSALDYLRVPQAPVEATIALSILLVAAEILRDEQTWTRRFPWVVAFAFGLLHGFGFAGALREIGLPTAGLSLALASFNLGVELGQLLIVAVGLALARVLSRVPRLAHARAVLVYALGTAAGYWTLERCIALLA